MSPVFRTYSQATRYLDRFVSYEKTPPPKYGTDFYELGRMHQLLDLAGRPERSLRCIHIAGTDGKGSTAAFLEAFLRQSGYRVGLYTSPHLFEYTERIRVNQKDIPRSRFAEILSRLSEYLERIAQDSKQDLQFYATVFELLTVAALVYFKEQKVDYAVIETGLGGRLDATNVITPLVSVITPIDREHEHLLGRGIEKIAFEKAGIVKPGVPVIVSRQKPAAMKVIERKAQEQQSPLYKLREYLSFRGIMPGTDGYRFDLYGNRQLLGSMVSPLLGRHQASNLSMALLVFEYLRAKSDAEFESVQPETVEIARKALGKVRWQGRLELQQLPSGNWILDSAHSPQAARSLRRFLDDLFGGCNIHFLIAFGSDKKISRFLRPLVRPGDKVSLYRSSHPRATAPEELLKRVPPSYALQTDAGKDIRKLLGRKRKSKTVFCVCGSIFWVADVKKAMRELGPEKQTKRSQT